MKITQSRVEKRLTLSLNGRLDTATAPTLDAVLRESLEGVGELVLDMRELEYISSAGLRIVLKAQKIMSAQGAMRVVGANESVLEVFEITGFSDILTIE